MGRRRREALVPQARGALDQLKLAVAREVGVARRPETAATVTAPQNYEYLLERFKWHIAEELGLDQKVRRLGWADMPTRECGTVGGRLGGQIGGRMVRRMIALAEERIARGAGLPPGPPSTAANFLPPGNPFGRRGEGF